MEAPKEIFLRPPGYIGGEDNWIDSYISLINFGAGWTDYLRKDIHDATIQNLLSELKELRLDLDNALINSQARIKELEEALRFYKDDRNIERSLEMDETGCYSCKVSERRGISVDPFGTTARKALEKESDG